MKRAALRPILDWVLHDRTLTIPTIPSFRAKRILKKNEYFTQQLILLWQMSLTFHGRWALSEIVIDDSNSVHPIVKDLMVTMMERAPVRVVSTWN